MRGARIRFRSQSRRRSPRGSDGQTRWTLPPHPFRYSIVATLGVGVGLAILSAASSLGTVFIYVGVAFFLAIAAEPIVVFATKRRAPRWAAVLAMAIAFLMLVAFVSTVIMPAISGQITALAIKAFEFAQHVPDQEWFRSLTAFLGDSLDLEHLVQQVAAFVSDPGQLVNITGGLLSVGTGIIDAVTGVLVVTALSIYMILTLPSIKTKAYALVSYRHRAEVQSISEDVLQSVGRYVGGQIVLATANATVTLIVTSSVGSPAPALLALVAFVGALIPVVGPVIGVAVASLITLDTGLIPAIITAAVLLVYLQVEAYVLTPRVMARAIAVPGALVIVAALGGAAIGGILGAFVAIPIAAAGLTILNRVVIPHQEDPKLTEHRAV